jgi:phage-related baseplate assembly protein
MATLTFEELLAGRTADQIRERLFARLNVLEFPVTDFEPGAVVRTLVEMVAEAIADNVGLIIPRIAGGGFVDEADVDWLTLLAHENYEIEKIGASYTTQFVVLRFANGSGPVTKSAGDLVVEALSGNRYVLDETVTIPVGTLVFPGQDGIDYKAARFRAESPGAKYADAAGSIVRMITPLNGVSVVNSAPIFSPISQTGTGTGTLTLAGTPTGAARFQVRITGTGNNEIGALPQATFDYSLDGSSFVIGGLAVSTGVTLPGGTTIKFVNGSASPSFVEGDTYYFSAPGSPILTQGADEETRDALAKRMKARWPSLAEFPTADIYEQWARAASTEITKVTVVPDNTAATPGRVKIVIAGAVNPLATAAITAQAYIDARHPITDHPAVIAADFVPIEAAGVVVASARDLTTVQEAAQLAWQVYLASLPIGGTVRAAKLAQIIMDAGAVDFVYINVGPAGDASYLDYTVGDLEVPQASTTDLATLLTWTLA